MLTLMISLLAYGRRWSWGVLALVLVLAGPVGAVHAAISPGVVSFEAPLARGQFYTQANGHGGFGGTGYAIVDDDAAAFWSRFRSGGGVDGPTNQTPRCYFQDSRTPPSARL